MSMGLNDKPLF